MQAFQQLLASGRIRVDWLTTHEFPLDDAPRAYEMIVQRSEPHLGIVLRYDVGKALKPSAVAVGPSRPAGKVGIAFIGAGSYAQGNLLPNLPQNDRDVVLRAVMTSSGTTSKRVAERFGFERCTSDVGDILGDDQINTVFVATRHESHGRYVRLALEAGKHVFVEKPLCLTEAELAEIVEIQRGRSDLQLMVGFNRRFAPLVEILVKSLGSGPAAMIYRVNAGAIPADSWIQDASSAADGSSARRATSSIS